MTVERIAAVLGSAADELLQQAAEVSDPGGRAHLLGQASGLRLAAWALQRLPVTESPCHPVTQSEDCPCPA